MSELRIVRGNTFFTRSEVTAKTYAGDVIDDFDLSQATDIRVGNNDGIKDIEPLSMEDWE